MEGYNYKKATIGLVVILGLALAVPFFLPIDRNEPVNPDAYPDGVSASELVEDWQQEGIECIPREEGGMEAKGVVDITIISRDGVNEEVPAYIGVLSDCVAELHTRDIDKKIYIHSDSEAGSLTLGDFFAVWYKDLERPGQKTNAYVNGERVDGVRNIVLQNGQDILLEYQNN